MTAESETAGTAAALRAQPARTRGLVTALKDTLLTGLVALGLFGPLIGLQTVAGELTVQTRWRVLALTVAVVMAGRLALTRLVWREPGLPVATKWFRLPGGMRLQRYRDRAMPWLGLLLGLLAVGLPFLMGLNPAKQRYWLDLSILVLTYVMLGWGLNIVVGLAGLLDLGYVAFYAVGAYSYALLAQHFGWGFWLCLPVSGLLAACWGLILGFPVLRLRGDYLAIVTLAFGEIIRIILINWASFTGGPNGISGIPRPTLFGLEFKASGANSFAEFFGIPYSPVQRIIFLYYLILALALLTNFVTLRLRRLPIGRAWEALREDEVACRSLGINTTNTKLTAFAIGAMFGGFAGCFFATRQAFISPESFVFMESALILAIVVLGGLGSQIGVVIAALVMIGGFEFFREFAEYRMLVFGLAMVLIMIWRPRGLIATRSPSIVLGERRGIGAEHVRQGRG